MNLDYFLIQYGILLLSEHPYATNPWAGVVGDLTIWGLSSLPSEACLADGG